MNTLYLAATNTCSNLKPLNLFMCKENGEASSDILKPGIPRIPYPPNTVAARSDELSSLARTPVLLVRIPLEAWVSVRLFGLRCSVCR
jgi:hypothetical protein